MAGIHNMCVFLLSLLCLCSFPSFLSAFFTCSSAGLSPSARLNAIEHGITFDDIATEAVTTGFNLCFSIGGGANAVTNASLGFSNAVNGQLDTGSTGVVVPAPTLPVGSYQRTGVCHVFDFDSSLNTYFGEMVLAHVRFWGNDTDGRYYETNPMPILAVDYTCKGATCLSSLAQYKENCTAIRAVIATLKIWTKTTVNSTTAMFGIGMNRGAVDEGYLTGPQPLSRNPILHINLDPLAATLSPHSGHISTVAVSSLCSSTLNRQSAVSSSSLRCNSDAADPFFQLNSAELIPYGFLLSASNLVSLYTYPTSAHSKPSPLSSPIFSCQSFPTLLPSSPAPEFTCFDTAGLHQKLEIFSEPAVNNSVQGPATWTGIGNLLTDTGLDYFIDNTPNYPCLDTVTAMRMTFPVPAPNSTQTNTPYEWTFNVNWAGQFLSGGNPYYPTSAAGSQLQPHVMRLWLFNSSTPCQNVNGVQNIGIVNSGRFIYNSFVLMADFINGVQGYAAADAFKNVFTGVYENPITTTTPPPQPTLSVALSSYEITVSAGSIYYLTSTFAQLNYEFPLVFAWAINGLPFGVTGFFFPFIGIGDTESSLSLLVGVEAVAGTYQVTVAAETVEGTASAQITLHVENTRFP